MSKTYNVDTHATLLLAMDLYLLDTLDYRWPAWPDQIDYLKIYITDVLAYTNTPYCSSYNASWNLCLQSDWGEEIKRISILYPHSASSFTLKFLSTQDGDGGDESYGFYNLTILALKCPVDCETCDSNSFCSKCKTPLILLEGKCVVACPDGFIKIVDNNIQQCKKCKLFDPAKPYANFAQTACVTLLRCDAGTKGVNFQCKSCSSFFSGSRPYSTADHTGCTSSIIYDLEGTFAKDSISS